MQYILCLLSAFVLSQSIQADTYQYEMNLNYGEADSDFLDEESIGFNGTYYFSPIDDSKGPLAEAAFLNRSSWISFSYRDLEEEASVIGPIGIAEPALTSFSADPDLSFDAFFNPAVTAPVFLTPVFENPELNIEEYVLEGRFIMPESGWFFSAVVSQSDGDGDILSSEQDLDGESISLAIGKYLFETTTLTLSFVNEELDQKISTPTFGCTIPILGLPLCSNISVSIDKRETETETWELSFKHLGKVGDYSYTATLDVSHISTDVQLESDSNVVFATLAPTLPLRRSFSLDDIKTYSASVVIYPLDTLGVGLQYALIDQDGFQSDIYGASVSWFITNSVAVSAAYSRIEPETSGLDADAYDISLTVRF